MKTAEEYLKEQQNNEASIKARTKEELRKFVAGWVEMSAKPLIEAEIKNTTHTWIYITPPKMFYTVGDSNRQMDQYTVNCEIRRVLESKGFTFKPSRSEGGKYMLSWRGKKA